MSKKWLLGIIGTVLALVLLEIIARTYFASPPRIIIDPDPATHSPIRANA